MGSLQSEDGDRASPASKAPGSVTQTPERSGQTPQGVPKSFGPQAMQSPGPAPKTPEPRPQTLGQDL